MKKKQNNGFTLVELLAVIVILAIILVIAVPKVMSVIEDSKKATLESTAKMIASAAEKAKVQNTVLGNDKEITCDSVAKINNLDYDTCSINFEDNTAIVTIKGKGKFANLNVCNGTKTNALATTEECTVSTLVTHIKGLYEDSTTRISNGLMIDNTVDENIRYSGSNEVVKNYVEFNNETWRIIGVFEVKTASGTIEELVKIVREDSIGLMSWDSSDSTINGGNGINQWGLSKYTDGSDYEGADLMQLLNAKYLSKQNAENACYDVETEVFGTCNFNSTGISSTNKSMIEKVVWNTGSIDSTDLNIMNLETYTISTTGWYNAERGTVGKICSSTWETGDNPNCTDVVERTTAWEGLVALPYGTDYAYASSESVCYTNMWAGMGEYYETTCKNNNWMIYEAERSDYNYFTWLLSPYVDLDSAFYASVVFGGGMVSRIESNFSARVRPTLYLKSNIQIADGDGSMGNAYKLK